MILQDYSSANTVVWDTSGASDRNWLQVKSRNADSQDAPVKDTVTFWVNEVNPITDVILSTNVASPQTAGVSVTITGQASGGTGSAEYQFRVKSPSTSEQWVILQDYSPANTVVWDTSGALGRNWLQVKSRNAGSQDKPVRNFKRYTISN